MILKVHGGCHGDHSSLDLTQGTKVAAQLPLRENRKCSAPLVQLHPFQSESIPDGVIVRIQPPWEPAQRDLHHVPCDLVLSIDVSGSMNSPAPVPPNPDESESEEETGLSVLDLVKHAALAVVETLDARDRLGIVTFSNESKAGTPVLQPLIHMTETNKLETRRKIQSMRPDVATNLWHGIRDGLGLFKGDDDVFNPTGRVPGLLVLTDGMPNFGCPRQGYVPKLRSMGPLPASIHTFGFGYSLRSGLLKSVAEVSGGSYSFIPDAGMIGTVIVHAVANLQSTFANNAKLRLTYPSYLQLQETTGEAVDKQQPVDVESDVPEPMMSLTIQLGNLQYGQSRDVYLAYGNTRVAIQAAAAVSSRPVLTAVLEYQHFTAATHDAVAHCDPLSSSPLDRAEIAYHVSRSALIAFLSALSPLNDDQEHKPLTYSSEDMPARLSQLVRSLPASSPDFAADPDCRSLLIDLIGTEGLKHFYQPAQPRDPTQAALPAPTPTPDTPTPPPAWTGQVSLALLHARHYRRWGAHFLPSLAGAHARQACNSFKDAGPLRYGRRSPLFAACRARLDEAFDGLPPPAPSLLGPRSAGGYGGYGAHGGYGGAGGRPVSMKRYNNAAGGCFAGCARVLVAGGEERWVRIGRLREGSEVVTPRGPRRVAAVVRMSVRRAEMCLVKSGLRGRAGLGKIGLLVTPWHPVRRPDGNAWEFPKYLSRRPVRYTGAVYSVMLERDGDADAHAILVDGLWGVTMGHGLMEAGRRHDVRVHGFFGDYDKVSRALGRLSRVNGVSLARGLARDGTTGRVNGFSRVDVARVKTMPAAKSYRQA